MTMQSCCSKDWDERQRFENDYNMGPISLHEINITNLMGERERKKKKSHKRLFVQAGILVRGVQTAQISVTKNMSQGP